MHSIPLFSSSELGDMAAWRSFNPLSASPKELRLHDPQRIPRDWTGHLSSTQVAVFLCDVKTHVQLDLEGRVPVHGTPSVCYVFDSMPEAEAFCRDRADRVENILCEIYDQRGKILPLRTFTHVRYAGRVPNRASARRMIRIAWLLVVISPLLFWIDYHHDGTLIVPTVVGFACIVTALRLLYWGHSELGHATQDDAKIRGN
jgi:hypothetical protein